MRTFVWTGSRSWQDVGTIVHAIEGLRKPFRSIVGGASGFDTLVENQLHRQGLPFLRFDAKWDLHGRRLAGNIRNGVMITQGLRIDPECQLLVGWDGTSTGTEDCMIQAAAEGMPIWRLSYYPELNGG